MNGQTWDVFISYAHQDASSFQAYRDNDYEQMLIKAGFRSPKKYPSLVGRPDEEHAGLIVWVGVNNESHFMFQSKGGKPCHR